MVRARMVDIGRESQTAPRFHVLLCTNVEAIAFYDKEHGSESGKITMSLRGLRVRGTSYTGDL